MKRLNSILVYLNVDRDDKTALDFGMSLANAAGARLKVVDVLPEPSRFTRLVDGIDDATIERLRDNRLTVLAERVAEVTGGNLTVETDVFFGVCSVEVIRDVLRRGHDLVLKTAEGGGGLRPRLFGSTAQRLLRKCPCAVWIAKPSTGEVPKRIVACVNPDPESDESLALNRRILELGASFSGWCGARLEILHAWDAGIFRRLRRELSVDTYRQVKASFRRKSEETVRTFVSEVLREEDLERLHFVVGDPALAIPRFVREERVDMLVMGSLGRTGVEGMVLGSVADQVFGEVECSVLALKPEAFVSPITLG